MRPERDAAGLRRFCDRGHSAAEELAYSPNLGFAYDKLGMLPQSIDALQKQSSLKRTTQLLITISEPASIKPGVIRKRFSLRQFHQTKTGDADALNNLGAAYYITEQYPRHLKLSQSRECPTRFR